MNRRNHTVLRPITICITLVLAVLFAGMSTSAAKALNNTYDQQFYQGNGIYWYRPGDALQCAVPQGSTIQGTGQVTTANSSNNNRDYLGNPIIPDKQMELIKKFQPIYEQAAKETNIPWQLFAVIHIRESVLADYNPENGQGIYQDYEGAGAIPGEYTRPDGKPGYLPSGGKAVSDKEFLRQTIYAGTIIKQKAGDKFSLVQKGDPDAIKDMFFGYNGRAAKYVEQAKNLGFSEDKGYEGSPYVMNRADAKRDPTVDPTKSNNTWGQVKVDNGPVEYPANGDYGAFVMYAALTGVPTTGASGSSTCTTAGSIDPRVGANGWATSGPNSMVVYYQDEEPWASKMYGPHTIKSWGCGPTSTAMAIATLNKDPSIDPENMSKFFYDHGYQTANDGTSWAAWEPGNELSKAYGVTLTQLGTDMSKAAEALKRGSFVVISANGCPFACAGGHILLFRGMTSSGKFLVADPNKNWGSGTDSNKTMNDEGYEVTDAASNGIRNMWEISKSQTVNKL